MKKNILLILIILACFVSSVFAASAPVISATNIITLKAAQGVSDTIPPPITTDDTADVKGYANLAILANVSGANTSWRVTPYYSDGTTYHIGILIHN